jgi:penicillin-binding protein 2
MFEKRKRRKHKSRGLIKEHSQRLNRKSLSKSNARQNHDSVKSYTRRAFFIAMLQAALLSVLGARLAWLQIVKGEKYHTLSEKNRIDLKMLAPIRGDITDRTGRKLVVNDDNYRVVVVPEQAKDLEATLWKLADYITLDERRIRKILRQAKKQARYLPLEVKDQLIWKEVAAIEVNLPDFAGVSVEVGDIRQYKFAEAFAHVTGYVGVVNKSELASGDRVLRLPGFRIGKDGLEKYYDLDMRGRAGQAQVEVNVVGREVRELARVAPIVGKEITLSLDAELQLFAYERLSKEVSASAVIMDVHSGAVYSMASYPSFDPNLFTRGLPLDVWEEWRTNPGHPLTNKTVSGQYPPGSTFKMMTGLAGLQSGQINHRETQHCSGHYDFGRDRFHCWKRAGHGNMNLVHALGQSCDTYFYKHSTEIGIDKISEVARQFGLGDKLGIGIPAERPGLMPDKDWKYGRFGTRWQPGETIVASIGQGYLLTTPLQLAVMTSRLVNGGYAVEPWLTGLVGQESRHLERWEKMHVDPWHLNVLRQGMENVMMGARGTARSMQVENPDFAFAGKTGTSQVRRISAEQRSSGMSQAELDWKHRHHALFVGYAPYKNPRYACAVVVEHGGSGSAAAAPVARDLLAMAQSINPAAKPLISMNDGLKNLRPAKRRP